MKDSRIWLYIEKYRILIYIVLVLISFDDLINGNETDGFGFWIAIGIVFFAYDFEPIWKKLPINLKKIVLIFLSVFFISFIIIGGFIISGFFAKEQANLDYIVVLGEREEIYKGRSDDARLRRRLKRAVKYLNENENTKCIVCDRKEYIESGRIKKYLEKKGISEYRIIMEIESPNTEQDIKKSLEYIENGASVGIVTNDFSMFRALQIARKSGFDNVCGVVAGSSYLLLPVYMFAEFFSEIKFLVT